MTVVNELVMWTKQREATQYFDKVFEIMKDEKFYYDKQYERIIEAYTNAGWGKDARKILDELIARQSCDKKFLKLEKYKAKVLKRL